MSDYYLTDQDVQNYGPELLNVTQRAALHAVSPHLQAIQQDNAALRQQLAVEARRRLDDQVARAVPDFRQVDSDPRWHRWLLGVDVLSGRVRQTLLNEAISSGSAARVKNFFDMFKREVGSTPASTGSTTVRPGPFSGSRSNTSIGTRTYTPDDIAKLYRKHQQGAYANREAEWARIEQDIFASQKDGRLIAHPYLTK